MANRFRNFPWRLVCSRGSRGRRRSMLRPQLSGPARSTWRRRTILGIPSRCLPPSPSPLAGDLEARDTLTHAVGRTARRDADGSSWVANHLRLADFLADVVKSPEAVKRPGRAPRPGDLVVLGSALDPRVRIALEVVPSGASDKITVLDPDDEDEERHFLTTHVNYVEWLAKDAAARRIAGA